MSTIEWTNETWNFLRGCTRNNLECDRCYAISFSARGLHAIDAGLTKRRGPEASRPGVDWTGQVAIMRDRLALPLRWRRPRRVFVNSMSDLFHPGVPFETIAAAFGVMAATPRHTYQILTKLPERALEFFRRADAEGEVHGGLMAPALHLCSWEACEAIVEHGDFSPGPSARVFGSTWPLPNVHLGVSAGRQCTVDEKVPILLQLPAAVRWVSVEPMIGPVDLERVAWPERHQVDVLRGGAWDMPGGFPGFTNHSDMSTLDWVVVGGESGPGARPCNLDWIRAVLEQCRAAGVPAFVKQLGRNPEHRPGINPLPLRLTSRKGGDMAEWPTDLRVREWPKPGPSTI